jgi:hypothetical protein
LPGIVTAAGILQAKLTLKTRMSARHKVAAWLWSRRQSQACGLAVLAFVVADWAQMNRDFHEGWNIIAKGEDVWVLILLAIPVSATAITPIIPVALIAVATTRPSAL